MGGSGSDFWMRRHQLSAVSTTPQIADRRQPMADGASPASQGFRMPAEWERHRATWIGGPHNASDWPGKFAPIPWSYGEIVRRLARGANGRGVVNSLVHEPHARRVLERLGAV